jgi:phospholipid/cholesterol/gamma-HCH transport system substrate-binding protein
MTTSSQPPKPPRRRARRHPAALGALGLGFVVLAVLSVFGLDNLPIIGAGLKYSAYFSEAAGLKSGNEVRIAGVKVGQVTDVKLAGDKVRVWFKVSDAWIGDDTTASIQIKTLLGQKYLALDPEGDRSANPDIPIPLSHTVSPYDVIDAFSDAATQITSIDTNQLAASMEVLSQAFAGTPGDVRAAIVGVSRLSDTFGKRDAELRRLLAATSLTTKVLANRDRQFEQLIAGGGELLTELNLRQQALSKLLSGAQTVAAELSRLVRDNKNQIGPALTNLSQAIDILNANQANITKTLQLAAPFYGIYANVLGNGRWFDAVVTNLLPPQLPEIPGYRLPIRNLGGGH